MIKTTNLEETMKKLIKVHDVLAISGAPGIGKSEITYKVAKDLGMKMLEVRLYEQGEVAIGLPKIHSEVTSFSKPFWVKELEDGNYDILFFDDFHLVPGGIQKFLYRPMTSRQIHDYHIPVQKIILAGNFNISSANACQIQSPIMGRIECFIEYNPNVDVFMKWARTTDRFDARILAFLASNPDLLYDPDPAPSQKYPSPRTWEHLSKNIQALEIPDFAPAIVGQRAGSIFQDYWPLLSQDPEEILQKSPENTSESLVFSMILAAYYCRTREMKTKKRILDYIYDKLEKDVIYLFCKFCYSKLGDQQFFTELEKLTGDKFFKMISDIYTKMNSSS